MRIGAATYNKCAASGKPGDVERVLSIYTTVCLEFYKRSTFIGLCVDWKAPYGTACDTLTNLVQLAQKLERSYLRLGQHAGHDKQSLETITKHPEDCFLPYGEHACTSITRSYGPCYSCKRL